MKTCKECKHWKYWGKWTPFAQDRRKHIEHGSCFLPATWGAAKFITDDVLITDFDFGCNQFEAKDALPPE
jgi:hypothetical protein